MDKSANTLPKAVIFDLDGTLIEDKGAIGQIGRRAKNTGYDQALEQTKDYARKPVLGGRKWLERWFRLFSKQPAKDGAVELLSYLKQNDVPVFVVSVGNQDIVRNVVRKTFGDLIDIDKVYGSGTGKPVKPNPEAYLNPLREHQIDTDHTNDIMVVGDTVSTDLEAAITLNMKAVYLNDHGFTNDRIASLTSEGALHEVDSLRALHEQLKAQQTQTSAYVNSVPAELSALLEARMAQGLSHVAEAQRSVSRVNGISVG